MLLRGKPSRKIQKLLRLGRPDEFFRSLLLVGEGVTDALVPDSFWRFPIGTPVAGDISPKPGMTYFPYNGEYSPHVFRPHRSRSPERLASKRNQG